MKRLWLLLAQHLGHPRSQYHGLQTMKKFKIKLTNWKPFQKQDMWKELIAWKVDASLGYAVKIFSKTIHKIGGSDIIKDQRNEWLILYLNNAKLINLPTSYFVNRLSVLWLIRFWPIRSVFRSINFKAEKAWF